MHGERIRVSIFNIGVLVCSLFFDILPPHSTDSGGSISKKRLQTNYIGKLGPKPNSLALVHEGERY